MKLVIAQMKHETNTFSSVPTPTTQGPEEVPDLPRTTSHWGSVRKRLPSRSWVSPGIWRVETTTVSPGTLARIRSIKPGSSFSARYLTTSGWTCSLVSRNR